LQISLPVSICQVNWIWFPDLKAVDLLVPTLIARDRVVWVVFECDIGHCEDDSAKNAFVCDKAISAADVLPNAGTPLVHKSVSGTAQQTVAPLPAVKRLVTLRAWANIETHKK